MTATAAPRGRFDEIFFVDLPDTATRAEILRIHAGKRQLPLADAEATQLAALCDGFSGAEIEQAVVSAVYAAHAAVRTAGAPDILRELKATRPLSVVMAERVEELRAWAKERTVAAN